MQTLGEMAKALNRSNLYVRGVLTRFSLPLLTGDTYPLAYREFLRTIMALRTFDIPEDKLHEVWHLEKKFLELIHVDSHGSPTWFLDSSGATTHPERRLLLTNHDLGVPLTGTEVQPGLDFNVSFTELFPGKEMGEDALRVLRECLKIRNRIYEDIAAELPHVRAAVKWCASKKFRGEPV